MDALAKNGVTFTDCHIWLRAAFHHEPASSPDITRTPTGVLSNGQAWQRTWVEQLRDAGYRCVNVGKMHTIPYNSDSGFRQSVTSSKTRTASWKGAGISMKWDKALAAHGLVRQQREFYRKRDDYRERLGAFDWELPEELHSDAFVANMAKWWVNTYPPTEPLFLQVGLPGPHPPYDPPAHYSEAYLKRDDLPLPKPTKEELESLPTALKEKRVHDVEVDHDSVVWSLDPTPEQMQRLWSHYLGNVTLIDEKIGELLEALKERGYLDDAIVIFTSDHGECLGDHGLIQKWSMYDVVTRILTIIWSTAGRFQGGRRGQTASASFSISVRRVLNMQASSRRNPSRHEAAQAGPSKGKRLDAAGRHVFCEQAGDVTLTGTDFITAFAAIAGSSCIS